MRKARTVTEALARPLGPWTLADLATLPDDGQRYEIIDRSLLVSPPPTVLHQGRIPAVDATRGLVFVFASGWRGPR